MPAPIGNKNAIDNNGGRPKIGLEILWDGWQEDIISMYKNGASDVEVRCLIFEKTGKLSYTLWDRWIKEEDEFSEIIKTGKMLSEAWWVKQGRVNLKDRDFSATLFYMNMKNRFKWSDKQEVDHSSSDGSMTPPTQIVFTKS